MSVGAPRGARARRDLRRSWVPWIPLALVVALALAVAAIADPGPRTNQERVTAIARTIKCPVCRGESVAESNAELSKTIRADIAARVERGEADEQIRDAYVESYGAAILLNPPGSGVAGLVWVIPVVALVVSLAGLVAAFRRWGAEPVAHATEADVVLVRDALVARHRAGGDERRDGGRP